MSATVGMDAREPEMAPGPIPDHLRGNVPTRTAPWTCDRVSGRGEPIGCVANSAIPGWCVYCNRPMPVPAPPAGWHSRPRQVVRARLRRQIRRVRRIPREEHVMARTREMLDDLADAAGVQLRGNLANRGAQLVRHVAETERERREDAEAADRVARRRRPA